MSDLDPELTAFVDILRTATPERETLAVARASVLSKASPPSGSPGSLWKMGLVSATVVAALALGYDPATPTGPKSALSEPAPAAEQAEPPSIPLDPTSPEPIPEPMPEPIAEFEAEFEEPTAESEEPAPAVQRRLPRPLLVEAPRLEQSSPTSSVAPSSRLDEALRDYARERYRVAASKLGEALDDPDLPLRDTERAEFFLAKCLFHLELFHASSAAFEDVVRRIPEHRYFHESLRWLALLSEHLPEPRALIQSVGRYTVPDVDALDLAGSRREHRQLLYLMGRSRYEAGRLDEGIALLRRVPDGSPMASNARFHEAVAQVRASRPRRAREAFMHVARARDERLGELAWLGVARLDYAQAMSGSEEERVGRLRSAMLAWARISSTSPLFGDAFFEETWALYSANEPARALGHVHAFDAPRLRERANPELLAIRAMVHFEHCQWEAVEHTLSAFHRRYDPVLHAAERTLRMAERDEDAFRLLRAVRARRSRVPSVIRIRTRDALADRAIGRQLAHIRSIDAERAGAPEIIAGAALTVRVDDEFNALRAHAVARAAELTRERLARLRDGLREQMNRMDGLEAELARAARRELGVPNERPMGPAQGQPVVAVQGGAQWPFDGEWWPDELRHYAQPVHDRCR